MLAGEPLLAPTPSRGAGWPHTPSQHAPSQLGHIHEGSLFCPPWRFSVSRGILYRGSPVCTGCSISIYDAKNDCMPPLGSTVLHPQDAPVHSGECLHYKLGTHLSPRAIKIAAHT